METCRSNNGILFTAIVMLVLFLSIYRPIFSLSGRIFIFEILLTGFFIILAAVLGIGVYLCKQWAWPGLLIFFSANLVNGIALYLAAGKSWSLLIFFLVCAFAFLASLIMSWLFCEPCCEADDNPEVETPAENKAEESFSEPVHSENAVTSEFEPGKYVASKTGARYHSPKCDWALKINEKNRVWYKTRREAEKEGKDPCNCTE